MDTDPEVDPGEEGDDPWWRLIELVADDSHRALNVALAVSELTDDVNVLAVLGAGAVEELLTKATDENLERILLEARRRPSFRMAFRCVWTSSMPPAVKARVDEALAAYGGNL
ncbi:DUF6869 domain-containing protein [Caulobacter sp. Root655]|uniref:DUF6869 domain-containing protein n=1 Tax=Caulobacter sp. Root655 TaxID=1736578 RepID=UPI0012E3EAE3|nr:hypothetical protein [Caulobacter sp. Root655]